MWHGEGLVLDDYPIDWADARVKAGLLWEPALKPVYALDDSALCCQSCNAPLNEGHWTDCLRASDDHEFVTPEDIDPLALAGAIGEVPNSKLVVRDDTNAGLGIVSDTFSLVFHSTMGQILESVLGIDNVKFETAGACKGGAQVWALAYLDEPLKAAGTDDSETYPYVVLLNNHDGSGACKLINTSVRVVCWNTYQAASMQGERSGRQFVFRHTGDVTARIEEAMKAIAGVRDDAAEWDALATELFGMPVDDAKLNHFVADFIPEPPAEVVSQRVRNNVDVARRAFKTMYNESLTTEAHRGTALGVVDTAVEYLDHVRGFRNRDTYLGRTLLRPEPLKAKAVALVRELCNA